MELINIRRDRCDKKHKDDNEANKNPTSSTIKPIVEALYAQKGNLDVIGQNILAQPRHITLQLLQRIPWIKCTSDFVKLGKYVAHSTYPNQVI
jgi:hypothetical protein